MLECTYTTFIRAINLEIKSIITIKANKYIQKIISRLFKYEKEFVVVCGDLTRICSMLPDFGSGKNPKNNRAAHRDNNEASIFQRSFKRHKQCKIAINLEIYCDFFRLCSLFVNFYLNSIWAHSNAQNGAQGKCLSRYYLQEGLLVICCRRISLSFYSC